MDFGDKKFVFIETKHKDAKLPYGQKLALERLCDAVDKDAVLIVAFHENETGDIDVGNCIVREWRYKKRWRTQFKAITVKQAVNKFMRKPIINKGSNE